MSTRRNYHIIPSPGGGWSVRRAGAERASGVFDRKSEAVEHGRQLARGAHSELVVHGRDGRIRDSSTFGRDPSPPKDRPEDRGAKSPKGFGSLHGKFLIQRGIDVTKPIFQQVTRDAKKRAQGDRIK